jgi:hypothetical protein
MKPCKGTSQLELFVPIFGQVIRMKINRRDPTHLVFS